MGEVWFHPIVDTSGVVGSSEMDKTVARKCGHRLGCGCGECENLRRFMREARGVEKQEKEKSKKKFRVRG